METGATFVTSMALRQQRVCDTPWSVPGTRTAAGADEYACESLFTLPNVKAACHS